MHSTFRVPLAFAYSWCTDYQPDDAAREDEQYERRILSRTARRVVYEDLDRTPAGWVWRRQVVTLRPPDRWHAESVGSHRTWSLDYILRSRGATRTELTLIGRRRSTELGGRNPSRPQLERELSTMWRRFGRAMQRDYFRSVRSGR